MALIFRNILACCFGLFVGGCINMALIMLGPGIIAPPAGVDVTDADALSRSIHLFEPEHFIFPFLAHAIGTLTGSLAAYLLSAKRRTEVSMAVGLLFLCGGITAATMILAPLWFIVLDLCLAYLPMAWFGARIGSRLRRENRTTSGLWTVFRRHPWKTKH